MLNLDPSFTHVVVQSLYPGFLVLHHLPQFAQLMSIESVMAANHLILCYSFLPPSMLPSIRVFSDDSALHIRCPKYWRFSFSISPSNIQGWFPLGLIGLISLQVMGLSRVFSSTTFESINFSVVSLLYGPTLTSIHDDRKNHSFDYMDICWQSDVSAF